MALVPFAGCFSLEYGKMSLNGEENLVVGNYGWYLFDLVPVVCGNANKNSNFPWAFFRDDVTMDKVQSRFMEEAKKKGKDISTLVYHSNDSVMLNLPNIVVPIPYLLTYHELQLSGVLK